MHRNSKIPESDISARRDAEDIPDEIDASRGEVPEVESSNKSGKHSSVQKQPASRSEAGPKPGASPKPGAFGKNEEDVHVAGDGRKSSA